METINALGIVLQWFATSLGWAAIFAGIWGIANNFAFYRLLLIKHGHPSATAAAWELAKGKASGDFVITLVVCLAGFINGDPSDQAWTWMIVGSLIGLLLHMEQPEKLAETAKRSADIAKLAAQRA